MGWVAMMAHGACQVNLSCKDDADAAPGCLQDGAKVLYALVLLDQGHEDDLSLGVQGPDVSPDEVLGLGNAPEAHGAGGGSAPVSPRLEVCHAGHLRLPGCAYEVKGVLHAVQ